MQIHVAGTNQTLFAFNNWGGDLGLWMWESGNPPSCIQASRLDFCHQWRPIRTQDASHLARPGTPATGLSATIAGRPQQIVNDRMTARGLSTSPGGAQVGRPGGRATDRDKPGRRTGTRRSVEMVDEVLWEPFSWLPQRCGGWYRMELRLWKEGLPIDVMVIEPVGIEKYSSPRANPIPPIRGRCALSL